MPLSTAKPNIAKIPDVGKRAVSGQKSEPQGKDTTRGTADSGTVKKDTINVGR
jgi:hypothetical protein